MNKALAARLNDPDISLFEALKIGGFNYPNADDTACVDEENISLLQRKNQLSRRLRTAKQQQEQEEVFLQLARSIAPAASSPPKRLKRSDSDSSDQKLQGNMARTIMSPPLGASQHVAIGSLRDDSHYQSTAATTITPGFHDSTHSSQTLVPFSQYGINHPTFAPSFIPQRVDIQPHDSRLLTSTLPQHAGDIPTHMTFSSHDLEPFNVAMQHNHPPVPSATDQLADIASHNGLSMEQLAHALSQKHDLVQCLVTDESERPMDTTANNDRKQLAMDLFLNETSTAYRRCMILAGYSASEVEEDSEILLEFALEAWHHESQRLQSVAHRLHYYSTSPPPDTAACPLLYRS
jgi:hypothetical protein